MRYSVRYGNLGERHKHYGLFKSKKEAEKAVKKLLKGGQTFNPRVVRMVKTLTR